MSIMKMAMKNAYIIHGWGGNPNEPMLAWLKANLEGEGYAVEAPEMPDTDIPKIDKWLQTLRNVVKLNSDTILIGHSIGCQAILRYLEILPKDITVCGVILIAPWMKLDMKTIEEEGEESIEISRPWIETPINFEKVKIRARKFIAIFSDNDPFVPLTEKDFFKNELGAEIIIEQSKGHFTIDDGVIELPSVLESVLMCEK